jgi:adenylate cyclase
LERRLAAILAADVVGYTRLMGDDEAGTLRCLTELREQVLGPLIAEHRGRLVKLMGDGLLIEFSSVVDAVACAVDWQKAVSRHEAASDSDKRLRFRIGVNLGDVMVEGEDLYGDGVNIAARLEGHAEPGGICISGDAYRQVKGKIEIDFEDLGQQDLKNVAEPVRIYRIAAERSVVAAASAGEEALAIQEKPSIAVLPFTNMSGDPEQEYFSDGLTEDIITALAASRSFPVIARNSSFTYKGKAVDVKQVAQELGAHYVLEGSVRKGGVQLRITVQLIDTTTGHHVWADRFDRTLGDVFELQDEITRRVAATIVPELEKSEQKRSEKKRTKDLNAWDYYQRGMSFLRHFTKEGNTRSREMFRQAIELDPTYSDAFSGLATSYVRDLLLECSDDREGDLAKVFEAAQRAVALDDSSAMAHEALGTAYIWSNKHDLALAETKRAVELNPSDAVNLHALGNKIDLAGDPSGISKMEQAQDLNRQDPRRHMYLTFLARAYLNARQYEKAVETAQMAVHWRPSYPHAHYILAMALGHLDQVAEARAALEECERLHPGFIEGRTGWQPYTNREANEHLLDGLRKVGLSE